MTDSTGTATTANVPVQVVQPKYCTTQTCDLADLFVWSGGSGPPPGVPSPCVPVTNCHAGHTYAEWVDYSSTDWGKSWSLLADASTYYCDLQVYPSVLVVPGTYCTYSSALNRVTLKWLAFEGNGFSYYRASGTIPTGKGYPLSASPEVYNGTKRIDTLPAPPSTSGLP